MVVPEIGRYMQIHVVGVCRRNLARDGLLEDVGRRLSQVHITNASLPLRLLARRREEVAVRQKPVS